MKDITIQTTASGATAPSCDCQGVEAGRRVALKAAGCVALAAGTGMNLVWAGEEGPRKGDWLVQVDDEAKKPVSNADLKVGEKPVLTYPYDPKAKETRDGSRLNRILLVKVDPAKMDAATKARSADGVVAYSAFCTHQGCDVSSWVAAEEALLCFCHFSKFDPRQEAALLGGPAPRPLPALPLALDGGKLVVADGFSAPPGKAV